MVPAKADVWLDDARATAARVGDGRFDVRVASLVIDRPTPPPGLPPAVR